MDVWEVGLSRGLNSSFIDDVDKFIQYVCSQMNHKSGDKVRCSCKKLHNFRYMEFKIVKHHLYMSGFVDDYFV